MEFGMLTGREREREMGIEENRPLRENKSFPRSSTCPSYIKEVSLAGPSDLACQKGLQQMSLCKNEWQGPLISNLLFAKGPVSYTSA
jgi:hypothetical protein